MPIQDVNTLGRNPDEPISQSMVHLNRFPDVTVDIRLCQSTCMTVTDLLAVKKYR